MGGSTTGSRHSDQTTDQQIMLRDDTISDIASSTTCIYISIVSGSASRDASCLREESCPEGSENSSSDNGGGKFDAFGVWAGETFAADAAAASGTEFKASWLPASLPAWLPSTCMALVAATGGAVSVSAAAAECGLGEDGSEAGGGRGGIGAGIGTSSA